MKLPDTEESFVSPQIAVAVVVVTLLLITIVGGVFLSNKQKKKEEQAHNAFIQEQMGLAPEKEVPTDSPIKEELLPESTLTPDDLDFWDLYPVETEEEEEVEEVAKTPIEEEEEVTPENDGKHTLVKYRDGSEEWVNINQHLPKNNYDFTNLVSKSDVMEYYIDSKKVSFWGLDISKYQDYVDFQKVRKAGVDFVMLRVGARGYGTGQLILDDNFSDNIKRATDAGLRVGVYFSSQAITEAEAIEEAELVISQVRGYRLDYPIAMDMGFVENDTARIENLSKTEKTEVMKAFLDKVTLEGYTGMIFADKEWLIKEVDLSKLTGYDVWLEQEKNLPDYPYSFSMWQYSSRGEVDGVSGYVNMNISFIDYAEK